MTDLLGKEVNIDENRIKVLKAEMLNTSIDKMSPQYIFCFFEYILEILLSGDYEISIKKKEK